MQSNQTVQCDQNVPDIQFLPINGANVTFHALVPHGKVCALVSAPLEPKRGGAVRCHEWMGNTEDKVAT